MKHLYLGLLIFILASCGGDSTSTGDSDSSSSTAEAQNITDTAGKRPHDYIVDYYKAVNADDYAALQNMCSKGYYDSIVTKNGFLKDPDPALFQKAFERKMFKHDSFTITERRTGFHTNVNAPDVYSVGCKVLFTNAYKTVFEKANGFKSEHINDEVCFKQVDGIWKVTDKLKGY